MLTTRFWLTIVSLCFLNMATVFQFSLYTSLPGPIGVMMNESFIQRFNAPLTDMSLSTVFSAGNFVSKAGELFGILVLVPLMDRFGRKFLVVNVRYAIISTVAMLELLAYAIPSFELFILSLFLNGAHFQIKMTASMMFIAECAPDKHRGFATAILGVGEGLNLLIFNNLGRPGFLGNPEKWYLFPMMAICLSSIVVIMYLWWIPDSPKYQATHGNEVEALQAIRFYHGNDENAETTLKEIQLETSASSSVSILSFREVWRNNTLRQAFFLVFAFSIFYEVSPITVEMLYIMRIDVAMGLSIDDVMTIFSLLIFIELFLHFVASLAIDRVGRRPMVFAGMIALFGKSCIRSVGLWIATSAGSSTLTSIIAMVAHFITTIQSAVGVTAIMNLLYCELLPANARVTAIQMATLVGLVISVPFSTLIPVIFNLFPPACYLPFVFTEPVIITYLYRNLPETKGKPVYAIIEDFDFEVRSRAATRRFTLISDINDMEPRSRSSTRRTTVVEEKTPLLHTVFV